MIILGSILIGVTAELVIVTSPRLFIVASLLIKDGAATFRVFPIRILPLLSGISPVPPVGRSIQFTTPVVLVVNTCVFAGAAAAGAISTVAIVPFTILTDCTELLASLAFVTALLANSTVPIPPTETSKVNGIVLPFPLRIKVPSELPITSLPMKLSGSL